MKHFDIIATISSPSPQVQPSEQSTTKTDEQILEDALLAKYVKTRKVKRKWLKKFWVIRIYNNKKLHGFSSISWMNG